MATAALIFAAKFATFAAQIERIFGFGPNPLNVPAAQIEQIFEAAGDNIFHLLKAGKISQQQASQGLQQMISDGTQYYNQKIAQLRQSGQTKDLSPLTNGLNNMTKVLNDLLSKVGMFPGGSSNGLTVAVARQYYVPLGSAGWYSQSLVYASNLADAFVTDVSSSVLGSVEGLSGDLLSIFNGTPVTSGNPNTYNQSGLVTAPSTNTKTLTFAVIAGLIVAKLSKII